jgi:hypothetical protein
MKDGEPKKVEFHNVFGEKLSDLKKFSMVTPPLK